MVFVSHQLYSIGKMRGNLDAQSRATLLCKIVRRQIDDKRDPGSASNLLVVTSTAYAAVLIFYHVPPWVACTLMFIVAIQFLVYYTNTRTCPTLVREVSDLLGDDAELLTYFYQTLEESHRQERQYRAILVESLNRMKPGVIQGLDGATMSRMVVALDLLSCSELRDDVKQELFHASTSAVRMNACEGVHGRALEDGSSPTSPDKGKFSHEEDQLFARVGQA